MNWIAILTVINTLLVAWALLRKPDIVHNKTVCTDLDAEIAATEIEIETLETMIGRGGEFPSRCLDNLVSAKKKLARLQHVKQCYDYRAQPQPPAAEPGAMAGFGL